MWQYITLSGRFKSTNPNVNSTHALMLRPFMSYLEETYKRLNENIVDIERKTDESNKSNNNNTVEIDDDADTLSTMNEVVINNNDVVHTEDNNENNSSSIHEINEIENSLNDTNEISTQNG